MFTAFVLALVGLALNLLRHLWVEHLFQRACRTTNPVAHVPPWLVSLAPPQRPLHEAQSEDLV